MDSAVHARLKQLGDLELALLLCLVMQEHCILATDPPSSASLSESVQLLCTQTFGLRPVIVDCTPSASVDDFNEAILIEDEDADENVEQPDGTARAAHQATLPSSHSARSESRFGSIVNTLDQRKVADVIIARSLDSATDDVQVQALELIRIGRIFSRYSMHVAPKDLLFVVILSRPGARLVHHLHDLFSMSHIHVSSGLRAGERYNYATNSPFFPPSDVKHLRRALAGIEIIAEMAEYVHNIEVFLRNSRYVKGGVTATATRNLRTLSRALALLHNLDYIPPSLVAIAAHKVYHHRLVLATAENEKTLLWGSDPAAIHELLRNVTPGDVLDEVIAEIEAPL